VLLFSLCNESEGIEWAGGCVEMPPGEMQVGRRFLKVAMTQQHLDGAQVGASFEQMTGKAVSKGMGMDVLVCETGAFGGRLTRRPEDLGGDRIACSVPSIAGKQPVSRLAPKPAPVDTQFVEQLRARHDIAVLASFAFPYMDDHPLAVDVADLQTGRFCAPRAGGIKRHQQDAVKGECCRVNQTRDLRWSGCC
jgi:hypothetical protein